MSDQPAGPDNPFSAPQTAVTSAKAGGRISPRTWWTSGILVLACVAAVGFIQGGNMYILGGMAIIFGIVALVVAIVFIVTDLRIITRSQASDPRKALRSWFNAAAAGRGGYVVAALAPTARTVLTQPPDLAPIVPGAGATTLDNAKAGKRWARTFAAHGNGQVRWQKIKRLDIVEQQGDVAVADVTASYQSWPRWANILSIVLFIFIRLIGLIVALVLYFSLRKRTEVSFSKTLLQGSDGNWYLVSGDLFDQVPAT